MGKSGFSTYGLLARHQFLGAYRAFSQRTNAYVRVILAVLAIYFGYTLFIGGWRFGQIVFYILNIAKPTELVNEYLFAAALSLFGLRFLFGKTPRFRATPYLHLPISRSRLVRYFQASSLVTLHNIYPLLFALPFWFNEVRRANPTANGTSFWLLGIILLLAISTWLNSWMRSLLSYRARTFAVMIVLAWGAVLIDQVTGTYLINRISTATFDGLLSGNPVPLVVMFVVCVALAQLSGRRLRLTLRDFSSPQGTRRRTYRDISLLQDLGPVGQLVVLELKLIWRNRRPRHNLMLSAVFSTVYVVALLLTPDIGDNVLVQSIVGLFASGGFALNYGQLMFGWESTFFDGLMSRDIATQTMVRAKFVLLQLSCVVFFFLSLPIFLIIRPELVALHVGFAIYNAGVTCLLIMVLAVLNKRRIELWRSGSFFNYEGFSFLHWLWILPISAPPLAIIMMLPRVQVHAAMLVSLIGLFGLLMTPVSVAILSERLLKRRYIMLSGFRAQ